MFIFNISNNYRIINYNYFILMKTAKINEETAKQLYPNASPELKSILEDTFGKSMFLPIEEKINSFEDALKASGRPEVPEFDCVPEDLIPFFKATYRCVVIAEAFNQGKRFDIYNQKQERYFPFFENNGSASAFGLSGADSVDTDSDAGSGSRLSFLDWELARAAGTKFKNEFRDMLSL